jgi:hypothetical protein
MGSVLPIVAISLFLLALGIWLNTGHAPKIGMVVGLGFAWLASFMPLFGLSGSLTVDVAGMEKANMELLWRWVMHLALFSILFSVAGSVANRMQRRLEGRLK